MLGGPIACGTFGWYQGLQQLPRRGWQNRTGTDREDLEMGPVMEPGSTWSGNVHGRLHCAFWGRGLNPPSVTAPERPAGAGHLGLMGPPLPTGIPRICHALFQGARNVAIGTPVPTRFFNHRRPESCSCAIRANPRASESKF